MRKSINALMRRKLLEQIYDKLSPEEKRLFIRMSLENKNHEEIMQALTQQRQQIDRMANKVEKQNWWTDFGSDISANFTTDGIIYLVGKLSRLFRR